jgi:hypothetical protein
MEVPEFLEAVVKECYIATAPPGKWSSGPSVIYTGVEGEKWTEVLDGYRKDGWTVLGPYKLMDASEEVTEEEESREIEI